MTDPQATSSANEAVDEMKEWREEGRKRAEEQERKDKEMWEESNEPQEEDDLAEFEEKLAELSSKRKEALKLCKYASLGTSYMKAISQALEGDVNPNEMCKLSLVGGDDRQKNEPQQEEEEAMDFLPQGMVSKILTQGQFVEEKLGALHFACRKGSPEIAELLLKHKADPNLQSLPYEYTPLHYAAQNNHIAVMNVLIKYGADIEAETSDHDRNSKPIHVAAMEGNHEAVDTLLSNGADINSTVSSERTALLIAAANGRASVVELLIRRKCDILKFPSQSKHTLWSLAYFTSDSVASRMISELKNIFVKGKTVLDLADCGLTHIPDCIKKCGNLRLLNFRDNDISTIPHVLFEMPFVQQVDLRGNKLPYSVVRALLDNPQPFISELAKGRPIQSSEMKLMICGQENIGKTTLLRWLKKSHDPSVSMNTITTDGVEISSVTLTQKSGGKGGGGGEGVTFRVWDFAGQKVYYQTHQFFLSDNGIYVLLWDLNRPPTESRMAWWLQSVASRAHAAPIVIVGTHLDNVMKTNNAATLWDPDLLLEKGLGENSGDKPSRSQTKVQQQLGPKEWLQKVHAGLKKALSVYPNVELITFFDGAEGRGLPMIIQKILDIAQRRAQSMPFNFLELSDLADLLVKRATVQNKPPVLNLEEMYDVAKKESNFFSEINEVSWKMREGGETGGGEDVKKRNLKRLEMGLYFLHDLGRLVYFGSDKSDGNMAGMVILQPQWLTRCLACIVTQEVKGTYIKEGKILHSDLINFVWRTNDFPSSLHSFLLDILEKFEVVFVMPNQPDIHVVPALLPEKRPDERLTSFTPLRIPLQRSFLQTQNPLNRQYVFQFLPSGLSTRLFIRVMKHYQKCEQCVYWRYGVFLSLPPSKKEDSHTFILVELDNERLIINLRVRSASAAVASGVLLVLTGLIQNLIHEWYHLPLSAYTVLVPCVDCLCTPLDVIEARKKGKNPLESSGSGMLGRSSTMRSMKQVAQIRVEEHPLIQSSSVSIAVNSQDRVESIINQVRTFLLKRVDVATKADLEEWLDTCKLYAIDDESATISLLSPVSLPFWPLMEQENVFFCFTSSSPLQLLSHTSYSNELPGEYYLEELEAVFMAAKTDIPCSICKQNVSLHSLVPDVVLSDVEQYGCEVAKEDTLTLTRKVGRGAFGDVYLGDFKGKPVAIKQILLGGLKAAEILKEFQKELRLGSMLNHPNIVKIEAFSMHPFQLIMEFIPMGDLYSFLNDPSRIQKYASEIDTVIESRILSVRRESYKFKIDKTSPSFAHLPLNVVARIMKHVVSGQSEEERTKSEQRMATVCVFWSLGVRESKGLDVVEKHFKSLKGAFDKMEESLASSKRPGSEKAKGEAQAMFEQFKKATTNRLVAREDKMTYEQAKAVHEGYLTGLNTLQEWHAECLKILCLSPELRIRLAIDFTAGMSYLHTCTPPIIHRDLKTPNVLLCSVDPNFNGPLAKVSDFGASAQMFMTSLQSGNIGSSDKAKKHVVTLTTWLAPEILLGQPYSKPSDVYAVGIMLWELLTRRHPFDHLGSVMNEVKVRQKVPSDDEDNRPPVPADGPEDYCDLMRACWDGNPDSRPTMTHVLVRLIELAQKFPSLEKVVNAKELLATFDYQEDEDGVPDFTPKKIEKTKQQPKPKASASGPSKGKTEEAEKQIEGKYQIFGGLQEPSGGGGTAPASKKGGKGKAKGSVVAATPPATSGSKAPATVLVLAEPEKQIWVGLQDGSLKVYNLETGKQVAEKQGAHLGAVISLLYIRSRVWSGGEDSAVKIWSCIDIRMDVPSKSGYLSKLSPSSKMVWQKRYFVLDGNNHELRYAESSKSSANDKFKGSVSLVIEDVDVAKKQRQPSMSPDDLSVFLSQAGYTSKISRDDSVGGPARGASGTFSASNPPPSSSDSFSSSSSGEGDMVGYDVTVKNVVTSKNKFKVVTKDRVFNLKAINDDKNDWMTAIMAATLKPIRPIHQIWMDYPPTCLSHAPAGADDKSENILIACADTIRIYQEQAMRRLPQYFQIKSPDKTPTDIIAMVYSGGHLYVGTKTAVYFINFTTMRQISARLIGVKGSLTCLNALKNYILAGSTSGDVFIWKNDVMRAGGEDPPLLVINPDVGSIRSLCFPRPSQMYCVGENGPAEISLKMAQNHKIEHEEKKLECSAKNIIGMSPDSSGVNCFILASGGELGYFS